MKKLLLGTSIKTTLTGYIGAAAYGVATLLQTGKFTTRDIVLAAVIAVAMRFAKDAGATGNGN